VCISIDFSWAAVNDFMAVVSLPGLLIWLEDLGGRANGAGGGHGSLRPARSWGGLFGGIETFGAKQQRPTGGIVQRLQLIIQAHEGNGAARHLLAHSKVAYLDVVDINPNIG
jgi:hypothetical protein